MADNRPIGSVDTPGEVVAALKHEVNSGKNQRGAIAALLRRVLDGEFWSRYTSPATGITRSYDSFREFVEKDLGIKKLDVLVAWVEPTSPDTAARVRSAWLLEAPTAAQHGGDRTGQVSATHSTQQARDASAIVSRLKRDHPGLAQAVIAGNLTPNAAARQLGWRKPRVLLTSPNQVATKLREHYSHEELQQIAELIST